MSMKIKVIWDDKLCDIRKIKSKKDLEKFNEDYEVKLQ